MKKIYTSNNRVNIYLLKASLEHEGIACFIKNEEPAGQAGGEIPSNIIWPELWIIDDDDTEKAATIIKEQLATLSKDHWYCPKCGEFLEGQFEVCWQCGTQKTKA